MPSKTSLRLRGTRVLLLNILLFASFTASLSLPHGSSGWNSSMLALAAFCAWSALFGYRHRRSRVSAWAARATDTP